MGSHGWPGGPKPSQKYCVSNGKFRKDNGTEDHRIKFTHDDHIRIKFESKPTGVESARGTNPEELAIENLAFLNF